MVKLQQRAYELLSRTSGTEHELQNTLNLDEHEY